MKRKTRKHRQYTIEEKNEIIEMHLSGQTAGIETLAKDLDVANSVVERWIKQYQEFGTTVDRRGKGTKEDHPNKGRPKKPMKNIFPNAHIEQMISTYNMHQITTLKKIVV